MPNTANCYPDGPGEVTDVGAYTGSASPYGTLCSRVAIHEGPRLCKKRVLKPASTTSGAFVCSSFANNPG